MSKKKWEDQAREMLRGPLPADLKDAIVHELWIRHVASTWPTAGWHQDHIDFLLSVIDDLRETNVSLTLLPGGGVVTIRLPEIREDIPSLIDLYGMGAEDLADSISKSGAGCGHAICVLESLRGRIKKAIEEMKEHDKAVTAAVRH